MSSESHRTRARTPDGRLHSTAPLMTDLFRPGVCGARRTSANGRSETTAFPGERDMAITQVSCRRKNRRCPAPAAPACTDHKPAAHRSGSPCLRRSVPSFLRSFVTGVAALCRGHDRDGIASRSAQQPWSSVSGLSDTTPLSPSHLRAWQAPMAEAARGPPKMALGPSRRLRVRARFKGT